MLLLLVAAVGRPAQAEGPPGEPTTPPGYESAPAPSIAAPPGVEPLAAPAAGPLAPAGLHAGVPDDEDVRFIDANMDRGVIFSTAETHPKGTFYFGDYELVIMEFGYAVTDEVQLSLSTFPPLFKEQAYFVKPAVKVNLLRGASLRAALMASGIFVYLDGESSVGGVLGGVGQLCFEPTCRSSVSLDLHAMISDDAGEYLPFVTAASGVFRISPTVAFLVEPWYTFVVGGGSRDVAGLDGFILNYGLRLSGRSWGVDISFIKPVVNERAGEDDVDDFLVLGLPFLSFTYRTSWDRRPDDAPPASRGYASLWP